LRGDFIAGPGAYTPRVARFLVQLAHSTEDPNRTAAGLHLAHGLAQAGHGVDLWLYGEGVRLGVKHVAEALQEPYPMPAAAMLDALASGGATFHCSRACFEQRGFVPTSLRPGARLADPADLARLLTSGCTPLAF
jgi:predicted peroxiredoxin